MARPYSTLTSTGTLGPLHQVQQIGGIVEVDTGLEPSSADDSKSRPWGTHLTNVPPDQPSQRIHYNVCELPQHDHTMIAEMRPAQQEQGSSYPLQLTDVTLPSFSRLPPVACSLKSAPSAVSAASTQPTGSESVKL